MYKGACPLTVDDKGRIAIPGRVREPLLAESGGRVITTMWYEKKLVIYPGPVWDEVEQKLVQLNDGDPAKRTLKEMLLGHADERMLDAQGRLLLSPTLRQYARLEREAEMIGQVKKLVLWAQQGNEDRYQRWDEILSDPNLAHTLNDLNL